MGSAAAAIAKHLDKLGFQMVDHPEHFWVSGALGPLAEGELDRAREFGRSLAEVAGVHRRRPRSGELVDPLAVGA